jgi:hypothetical protein
MWNWFICVKIEASSGIFEYANESSGFMKGEELYDQQSNYQLLKELIPSVELIR